MKRILILTLLLSIFTLGGFAQKHVVKRQSTTVVKKNPQPVGKKYSRKTERSNPSTSTSTSTSRKLSADDWAVIRQIADNMVYVDGGTFTMGATAEQGYDAKDYEKPAHQVTLSSYKIGRYEVTQREWEAVMGSNISQYKGDDLPANYVSWNDCQKFISKLNSLTGKKYRMPTEAEWEFAARGGNNSRGYKYAGSDDVGSVAWYEDNSGRTPHAVGSKQPNELGLYDMSGNVMEWCQDYADNFSSYHQTDPKGPSSGSDRIIRNGSGVDEDKLCRVSRREHTWPDRHDLIGLRLAISVR